MVTSASRSSSTCNYTWVSDGLVLRRSIFLPSGTASSLCLQLCPLTSSELVADLEQNPQQPGRVVDNQAFYKSGSLGEERKKGALDCS